LPNDALSRAQQVEHAEHVVVLGQQDVRPEASQTSADNRDVCSSSVVDDMVGCRPRTLTHSQAETPQRAAGLGRLRNRRFDAALTRTYQVESMYPQESLMEQVEKTIEVNCPISTVYNQWTQFEEFPRFMAGVKEVRQIDDTHVHWRAEIWGKEKEWDAEITEQEPDQRISWKSVSGAPNAGTVRFEPLDAERTRVRLAMAYEPEGAVENAGDALGIFTGRVEDSVEGFKKFIESRGRETGAWRGEVDNSRKV
jgi:uncharacterized membrane protein